MSSPHGSFIWYELVSPDPDASKAFYDAIIGWNIEPQPAGEMDYRMIRRRDGGNAGGVLRLNAEMEAKGGRPTWLGYVGVDDVDRTAEKLKAAGGTIWVNPWTIKGVGRVAMVTDPDSNPFYIMRGDSDGSSDAFSVDQQQRVGWNELSTSNPAGARRFYGELFGWNSDDFMPMGDFGDYRFFDHNGVRLGALCGVAPGNRGGWRYYVRVPSIEAAVPAITKAGGKVVMGPHEVPGGDHIVIGTDPHGAEFALVGAK